MPRHRKGYEESKTTYGKLSAMPTKFAWDPWETVKFEPYEVTFLMWYATVGLLSKATNGRGMHTKVLEAKIVTLRNS